MTYIRIRQHFIRLSKKGEGTASPYPDCLVILRIKIVVDGVEKFNHGDFDDLFNTNDKNCKKYDLEEYIVPSVIRKILKTTKLREIVEITCRKKEKLVGAFEDDIFTKECLCSFEKEVVITFALLAFEQKDYLFRVPILDKIERISFLKNEASKFYKAGNVKKAERIYMKINSYFRSKDAKNNFLKEDENTTMYRDALDELDKMNIINLGNICVIKMR